ncbi:MULTISPECIES: glycosyltransferase [Vibrio]|uniref:Glycosyltransferase n=1 Tax=Vibrio aestuarianus TaxID=28171 RepID=A0A9X4F6D8_9VIBR|nr:MULTISPECIES: glycosyltransferase [Vibrio]MDE1336675.1 glycosyltransferase [Vibrio aestuarianus]MDE1345684.1 glycosyltransferase [Vibrio aestuarianus]MDF9399394.1 glycosyltransferase family 2 protein [Vibrio sp. 1180_3]NGZ67133.1 glycosyltransferase family 2 protein [Vibrio aestuarianus subsp. cardii]
MLSDSFILAKSLYGMVIQNQDLWVLLFPMMIMIELPLSLLVLTGVFRWAYHEDKRELKKFPSISFIITCYGEGEAIEITIDTLVEQIYPGQVEVLAVVDGATQNAHTYQAALNGVRKYQYTKNRSVRVIPKWQRGGRVSTLNAGLSEAKGELVINVDGDTSFDNDMAFTMVKQFLDPNVIASGGALRVRNWRTNLLTRMQALEYMLSMQMGKTGMSNWGVLNNISGAFGAFRNERLKQVGGWDTHTAEDLDLTMRLKQYKRRYPNIKLAFTPHAVGHTDVPDTLKGLIMQRLRWDGDLLFLFLRKHRVGLTPKLLGWGNFIFTLAYGVVQNILLPILVIGFSLFMVVSYPANFIVSIFLLLYSVYLITILLFFAVYLGLVSERSRDDFSMILWLPLYPIYQFFMRLITAFSMVNELVRRSHEESSMAPWWVLKKGKRF